MKKALLVAFALFAFSLSVFPQGETPKIINGGVLNGKAVSLPKPAYPPDARAEKAEGAVAVDVVIDENGNVISAVSQPNDQTVRKNDDGTLAEPRELHPALRLAAETAALGARFSPTLLSGQPVQIKGRIVYNFAAGSRDLDNPGKVGGGPVLNGKATSLPTPDYPPAALAVRAAGAVSVKVVVDEAGNVISAEALSGHPLLRAAAVAAARRATFSPTVLSGEPVKVTGVVVYNFIPAKIEEKPEN